MHTILDQLAGATNIIRTVEAECRARQIPFATEEPDCRLAIGQTMPFERIGFAGHTARFGCLPRLGWDVVWMADTDEHHVYVNVALELHEREDPVADCYWNGPTRTWEVIVYDPTPCPERAAIIDFLGIRDATSPPVAALDANRFPAFLQLLLRMLPAK